MINLIYTFKLDTSYISLFQQLFKTENEGSLVNGMLIILSNLPKPL